MTLIKKLGHVFFGWWIVVASFVLFTFIGGSAFYGFTAFFNPIVDEMGWTRAQTSLAFSLRSVEGGVVQPVIGFLVDRTGTRKCIFSGIIVMGIALILMSYINSLSFFYVTFILLALGGTAALGIPQYAAVANWFNRRRAFAIGILSAGFGLSGIMTPILALLIKAYDWRNTLVYIGVGTLVIGLPLSLLIRHRPEQYGYLPDGDKPEDSPSLITLTDETKKELETTIEREFTVKQALKTRTFWMLLLFTLFPAFSMSAIMVHEMPFLISVGISENMAALTMTGITLSSLIGRLGFSWLGDIYDKRYLLAIAGILQTVGVFIFANISSSWMIIPFLLTFGPGYGAPIPLLAAMQADYFGTKSFASLRGLFTAGYMLPGIVAPFLAGLIFDMQGSYYLAFIIFAIVCSCAIPTILLIKPVPTRTSRLLPESNKSP